MTAGLWAAAKIAGRYQIAFPGTDYRILSFDLCCSQRWVVEPLNQCQSEAVPVSWAWSAAIVKQLPLGEWFWGFEGMPQNGKTAGLFQKWGGLIQKIGF